LARPAARQRRVLDITSILLQAPIFISANDRPKKRATYIGAPADIQPTRLERWLADRHAMGVYAPRAGAIEIRKPPILLAAEVIEFMTTSVEPEAWSPTEEQAARRRALYPDYDGDPLVRHGQWASIVFRDGVLIVQAPGFVHRALGDR